jgi:GNAT superfamily N-acetyltransferase
VEESSDIQVEVTEPETDEEFEAYYRLRYEQLRKPLGALPGSERDDPLEAESKHLIAKIDGRVVGAETWVVLTKGSASNPKLYAQSRQTAIDPEYQRFGIGSALLTVVEQRAREMGATEIIGYARADVVGWVESQGWKVWGPGPTLLGQIKHVLVGKPL